ncbi:non-ribosomal peptide synthetase [Actinomadura sp. 7K507]|uniref:non-ribosomal peptide synthetase n=1 Tax=Actinomadura sp. 7K507 TaxID=2530365 RepID=UPI001FB761C2|nr:non-ribosomal peptide synthetase [Actinomadura sp. 7K507]
MAANAIAPFFAAAERVPRAIALVDDEGRLSYEELARRARAVSAALADRVNVETLVSVEAPRGRDCLVAVAAVLHRGGTVVFSDPGARSDLRRLAVDPVTLSAEDVRDGSRGDPGPEPAVSVRPEHLAYVCPTSGSTGRPKWVGVPHQALVNRIEWGQRTYPLAHGDRVLWQADPTFDFAFWEMLAPLWHEAAVVIAGGLGQVDLRGTAERINSFQVTAAHFVPSVLDALLRVAGAESLSGLRYLFLGGEQFDSGLWRKLRVLSGVRVLNQYGPTETCIDSTWFDAALYTEGPAVPIGEPIDRTSTALLDTDGIPLPHAEEGELGIAGAGLARGYLGDPRATADRFVPNPDGPPGTRIYRTGDVVSRRGDGRLEFKGRRDDQVKVNGVRVELEEVRGALRTAYPASETAVTAMEEGGRVRLVAFVADQAADPDGATVVAPDERLVERLHSAKVPTVVHIGSLIRNRAGKPDLPAMVEQLVQSEQRQTSHLSPPVDLTPTEAQIGKIWCELLGISQVRSEDSFFELGAHSLMATELAEILEESFAVELPLREVFDRDSLRDLALAVDELTNRV